VTERRTILAGEPTLTAEPIRAWKRANLHARLGGDGELEVTFAGVGHRDATYSADDVARCRYGHEPAWIVAFHDGRILAEAHARVPDPRCTCGFYAVKDERTLREVGRSGVATLEVELLGAVDRYRRGYRAERQRVLRVSVDDRCKWCPDPAVEVRAVLEPWLGPRHVSVVPLCAKCSHGAGVLAGVADPMSLGDLADRLATEVVWGSPPVSPDDVATFVTQIQLVSGQLLASFTPIANLFQTIVLNSSYRRAPSTAVSSRRDWRRRPPRRPRRGPDRCAFQAAREAMHAGLALVLPPWPRSRADHPRPQRRRWWFLRRRPTSNGWSITNLGD
jgi:hypothetical protein